jgi:hypothetical protein
MGLGMFDQHRRWFCVGLLLLVLSGCGRSARVAKQLANMMKGWGALGEEVEVGPYRLQTPKSFQRESKPGSRPGAMRISFRGPVIGKSEPGILVEFTRHHMDLTHRAPNWSESVRLGMAALRRKCSDFSSRSDELTTLNGLPGVRFEFQGDFHLGSSSREIRGVGYVLCDDVNLIFILGVDFGSRAAANLTKLENSIKTIHRPGFSTPSYAWMNDRSSSRSGSQLASGNHSDTLLAGSSSPARSSVPPGPPPVPPRAEKGPSSLSRSLASRFGGSGQTGQNAASQQAAEARRQREAMERERKQRAAAADPKDPDFFQANLDYLRGEDGFRQSDALGQMTKADPDDVSDRETRQAIARAIRDIALDESVNFSTRAKAVPALVVWGSTHAIPYLVQILEQQDHFVRRAVLEELKDLPDERVIEPVTRVFLDEPALRQQAAECLRSIGAAAEDTVLELANPAGLSVCRETVRLLAEIGTKKSLAPLSRLKQLHFYRSIEADVKEAKRRIRLRGRSEAMINRRDSRNEFQRVEVRVTEHKPKSNRLAG